jgi:hypothetical protein
VDQPWPPPARLPLSGFVLRSIDIEDRSLSDVERIAGFGVGAFRKGVALYRLEPRLLDWLIVDPESHLLSMGLYPVGFNNERGPRDWDAVEIASQRGATNYNGYNAETVRANAAHYSPRATPFSSGAKAKVAQLVSELMSLRAKGGFIGKLLFPRETLAGLAPFENYPAGAGIREYQLLRPQPFERVGAYSADQVRRAEPLRWK